MISIFTLLRKNLTPPTNALCISSQYTWQPPKSTSKYAGIAICCFLLEISLISGSLLRSPTGLDVWYQGKRVAASACSNWHFQLVSFSGFCCLSSCQRERWCLPMLGTHALLRFEAFFSRKSKFFKLTGNDRPVFMESVLCPFFWNKSSARS
jgi:hypothetical protein